MASRLWRTLLAIGAGAGAFAFAPPDAVQNLSGELVNFFGFVIAAVIPAMALTSTALRGSGMSVRRINQLHTALKLQMRFWAGLVVYGFLSVTLVIVFKPIVACPPGAACLPRVWFEVYGLPIDTRLCNAALGFTFTLVFLQLTNVMVGLRSLLEVNAEAARGEAQQRFDEALAPGAQDIAQIKNPPGYGSVIELPSATAR